MGLKLVGNVQNLKTNAKRPILATIIVGLSIFVFFNMTPVYANPCTSNPCPVVLTLPVSANPGVQTIYFRDVNSPDNSTVTVSLDKPSYLVSQTATVAINDFNENLNPFAIDNINATIEPTGDLVGLTEQGFDTGVFQGKFIVPAGFKGVNYLPAINTGRLALILTDVATNGTVQFKDFIITPGLAANLPLLPVLHGVTYTLYGVQFGPGGGMGLNMSFSNAALVGNPAYNLQMCYTPDTVSNFALIEDGNPFSGFPGFITFGPGGTGAVVNDPGDFPPPPTIGNGTVTLCYNYGTIGGGGSSGLVSAGLVLNFLAGAGTANSAVVSPPSFGGGYSHYSDGLTLTQGDTTTTFDTSLYNQEIPKQVMDKGTPVNMTFKTFESYNVQGVIHMGLYVIPRGEDMMTDNSIASIVWEKGVPNEINDPNHLLDNATASSTNDGKFQYTTFSFTPTKSYDKMSFLVRAWNDHLYSTDIRVHDDIVAPQAAMTLPAGVIQYNNFDDLQAALEKDQFYKPQLLSHIHGTSDVFPNSEGGSVYWLYDTIRHTITLVVADKNDNVLSSKSASLQPYSIEKKGDYNFMYFTVQQLNRWNGDQLKNAMELEAAKAMSFALEKKIILRSNW